MNRRHAQTVVLIGDDVVCLELVAAELAASGVRVLCARDVGQAAAFVRAGWAKRFVLVLIAEEPVPVAELRAAMAAHLPGWKIECEGGEEIASVTTREPLVN